MNILTAFFCFLIFSSNDLKKQVVGEYKGGFGGCIWETLTIKTNGTYDYHYATHMSISLKDKGNWKLKNDVITLRSFEKTQAEHKGNKVGKPSFCFRNCIFEFTDYELLHSKRHLFPSRHGFAFTRQNTKTSNKQ